MSWRTLIEINHDYIHEMKKPDALERLWRRLSSGDRDTEPVNGIKLLGTRHHSDPEFMDYDEQINRRSEDTRNKKNAERASVRVEHIHNFRQDLDGKLTCRCGATPGEAFGASPSNGARPASLLREPAKGSADTLAPPTRPNKSMTQGEYERSRDVPPVGACHLAAKAMPLLAELATQGYCYDAGKFKAAVDGARDWLEEYASAPKMACPMPTEVETLRVVNDNMRRCLQWYADGNHFTLEDWEAPEGGNEGCWLCPPSEVEGIAPFDPGDPVDISKRTRHKIDLDAPWMVEDGTVARLVLAGGQMNTDPADEETIVHAVEQPKVLKHGSHGTTGGPEGEGP